MCTICKKCSCASLKGVCHSSSVLGLLKSSQEHPPLDYGSANLLSVYPGLRTLMIKAEPVNKFFKYAIDVRHRYWVSASTSQASVQYYGKARLTALLSHDFLSLLI